MLKEFALEPDMLGTWENFRYFIEKFGVGQGRLISQFPKNWRRLVYEAAQRSSRDVELKRIEERLSELDDRVLLRRGRPGGDASKGWLDRAIVEHAREPFAAIIAAENPNSNPAVMLNVDVHADHPTFRAQPQTIIQRTATDIVGCADCLLQYGRTIKWVDYVFDPGKPRWQRPLSKAISILVSRATAVRLEIHRECSNDIQRTNLKQSFNGYAQTLSLGEVELVLCLHPERTMHDRYVLVEFGGLSIGHGLDDNEDGGGTPEANVSLLQDEVFDARWAQFSSDGIERLVFRRT
jgi:hypothetical protein